MTFLPPMVERVIDDQIPQLFELNPRFDLAMSLSGGQTKTIGVVRSHGADIGAMFADRLDEFHIPMEDWGLLE